MDSSGIGFIIGRYKTVTALGGRLAVAAVSKAADRLLSMSGIYRLVSSCPTVEEAIGIMNMEVHK